MTAHQDPVLDPLGLHFSIRTNNSQTSTTTPANSTTKQRCGPIFWLACIAALVAIVLAVILPAYFTVIKKDNDAPSDSGSNGGGTGGGGASTDNGTVPSTSGSITGKDGSEVTMEDGTKFTYRLGLLVGHRRLTKLGKDRIFGLKDFAYIAGAGLNWVRIPIPYWAIDKQNDEPFPEKVCWKYILEAFAWARKTAGPSMARASGFQLIINEATYNHSGKFGQINFLYGPMGLANAKRALNYIRIITDRGEGKGFYISIGDDFETDMTEWDGFLAGRDRIALDRHPYTSFEGSTFDDPIATGTGDDAGGIWVGRACDRADEFMRLQGARSLDASGAAIPADCGASGAESTDVTE
ncbi:hypothetical protein BDZ89DRAFT_1153912 [Hymenopellis radicata]|nr:hypothetical protein BDZ89DRAFT_1153912 [Hymenopellis radicata]